MTYIDDLMREIDEDCGHAYLGAMDEILLRKIVRTWLDTPSGDVARQAWDRVPEEILDVADEFQDELQMWTLEEYEAYINEE